MNINISFTEQNGNRGRGHGGRGHNHGGHHRGGSRQHNNNGHNQPSSIHFTTSGPNQQHLTNQLLAQQQVAHQQQLQQQQLQHQLQLQQIQLRQQQLLAQQQQQQQMQQAQQQQQHQSPPSTLSGQVIGMPSPMSGILTAGCYFIRNFHGNFMSIGGSGVRQSRTAGPEERLMLQDVQGGGPHVFALRSTTSHKVLCFDDSGRIEVRDNVGPWETVEIRPVPNRPSFFAIYNASNKKFLSADGCGQKVSAAKQLRDYECYQFIPTQ